MQITTVECPDVISVFGHIPGHKKLRSNSPITNNRGSNPLMNHKFSVRINSVRINSISRSCTQMSNDSEVPSNVRPPIIDEGNQHISTASFTSLWGILGAFQKGHCFWAEGGWQFPLINNNTPKLICQTSEDENLSFSGRIRYFCLVQ